MNTKKILIALLIVALLSGLAYAGVQSQKDATTDRTETTTKDDKNSKEEKPKMDDKEASGVLNDTTNNLITDADQRGGDPSKQSTNNNQSGSISISTAQDVGDVVIVRTVVNGITSGSCNLKATNGAKSIAKSAPLGLVTNYYTCQGFDIDQAELGAGSWSVTVSIGGVNSNVTTVDVK